MAIAMLGKRPFIGKLSDLLISAAGGGGGGRAGPLSDPVGSPRTPFDFKSQSPRGPPRGYDLGGVGLGIVAALERSGGGTSGTRRVCGPRCLGRASRIGGGFEDVEVEADGCLENYTYVTCHGPNKKSFTKVYYDGGLDWPSERERSCRDGIPIGDYGVLKEPSSRITSKEEEEDDDDDVLPVFQTLDFLSSCHLCGKKLHDRDIYMYRGEKAFCSTECRSTQIAMDERKEQKCRNEASKAADVSTSPYTKDRIFSTGIVAI